MAVYFPGQKRRLELLRKIVSERTEAETVELRRLDIELAAFKKTNPDWSPDVPFKVSFGDLIKAKKS